jgi:hypothetical protein
MTRDFIRQQFASWTINFIRLLLALGATVGISCALFYWREYLILPAGAGMVTLLALTAFTFFYVMGLPGSGLEATLSLSGLVCLLSLLILGDSASPALTWT